VNGGHVNGGDVNGGERAGRYAFNRAISAIAPAGARTLPSWMT
jgi:hypothetical protein